MKPTNQKPQQESWQEKLIDPEIKGMLFGMIRDDVTIKDLENIISTERQRVIEEVREMVEGMFGEDTVNRWDLLQALNKW
jgi:hypothetical protein